MLSGANAFEISDIERMNKGAHQPCATSRTWLKTFSIVRWQDFAQLDSHEILRVIRGHRCRYGRLKTKRLQTFPPCAIHLTLQFGHTPRAFAYLRDRNNGLRSGKRCRLRCRIFESTSALVVQQT